MQNRREMLSHSAKVAAMLAATRQRPRRRCRVGRGRRPAETHDVVAHSSAPPHFSIRSDRPWVWNWATAREALWGV